MGRPQKRPDLTAALLDYLLAEGHKQSWVAKEFGVSQATISRRVKNLKRLQTVSSEPTQTVEAKTSETISATQAS